MWLLTRVRLAPLELDSNRALVQPSLFVGCRFQPGSTQGPDAGVARQNGSSRSPRLTSRGSSGAPLLCARGGCAEAPLGGRRFRAISPRGEAGGEAAAAAALPEREGGSRSKLLRSRRPEKSLFVACPAGLLRGAVFPGGLRGGALLGVGTRRGAAQLAPDSGLPPWKRGRKQGRRRRRPGGRLQLSCGRPGSAAWWQADDGREALCVCPGAPFIPPGWS